MMLEMVELKRCSKCGGFWSANKFYKSKLHSDGLNPWCKSCRRDYRKNYLETPKQREKRLIYNRQPHIVERKRNYMREYEKREDRKAYQKEYQREYQRKYRMTTKGKVTVRATGNKRRGKLKALPYQWTTADEFYAINYFSGLCAVCERPLFGLWHSISMDHWIPISEDGETNPGTIPSNMIPLCNGIGGCNGQKRDKRADIWLIEKYGKRKANKIMKRINAFFETVRQVNTA